MQRLEFYTVAELEQIVTRSAGILGVPIDAGRRGAIAQRSRGTPRIANRLLRRVRDYAEVKADGRIDEAVARAALDLLEVDPQGFDALDRKLLSTIIEKFDGGPVGIESLAAAIGEERGTLEDVIEPFLIQQGFLMRTARGRMATRTAYLHFGLKVPERVLGQPAAVRGREVTPENERILLAHARLLGRHRWRRRRLLRQLPQVHGARAHRMAAHAGHSQRELAEQHGFVFAVVEVKVNYRKPARLDDELRVTCVPVPEGRASIRFQQIDHARGDAAARRRRSARRLRRCEDVPAPAAAGFHQAASS